MSFSEIAIEVMNTPADGEDKLIETLKKSGASDEQVEAAVGHYRLQQGFKDQISKDLFSHVAKAADYAIEVPVEKAKKTEDEDEDEDKPFPPKKKTKDVKVDKSIPEEVQKSLDEKDAQIEELRKSLQDETSKRERNDLIAEIEKSYSHVPGKSVDEMADMLLAARRAGGDLEKSLRDQWAGINETVSKSALLQNSGSPLTKNLTGGAIDEMNSRAHEMVAKSDGQLDFSKAFVLVMDQEPELYQRYLEENPAQRQR